MSRADGYSNLLSSKEIRQRSQKNQQKLLSFLYAEKYSTAMILKDVVGIKTRAGICKVLAKLEQKSLVKRHRFNSQVLLWGITSNGIHEAAIDLDKITDWSYFEPSKINLSTLDHQLDIQRIHVICLQKNVAFKPGRALGSRAFNDKVPDGIITIGNKIIAVEVERSVKSKRRYDGIIYNYLKAIKAGRYTDILYVSPTPNKRDQIKKAIFSIEQITMTVNGIKKPLKIDTDKHLVFFEFVCLEEVEEYIKNFCNSQ